MAERTYNPSSTACEQWEAILADALDGRLRPENEAAFAAHMAVCPACAALFEEARQGQEWLEFLSPEPEVPAGLLDKILAGTGPRQADRGGLASDGVTVAPLAIPVWQISGRMSEARSFAAGRLMMTAAMAFFSIAMTLNITGVRLSDLNLSNLRPSMVRSVMERQLTMASTPIIRYYDHSPLVREVQSRVQDLRRTTQSKEEENRARPQSPEPGESRQAPERLNNGAPADAPRQSASPTVAPIGNDPEFMEASLAFQEPSFTQAAKAFRRDSEAAHSGGSAKERSTV
jgi:hypothetical protein